MTFPDQPIDVIDELLIDGVWTDITEYVRDDPGVAIYRQAANAARPVVASRMTASLVNNDGRFSNRLPTSLYYGKIGRNTRVRRRLRWFEDTFTRTSSDTWGSDWTNGGGAASDYDVNGTAGTHTLTSANVFRRSTATPPVAVADHTAVISVSAVATGAPITAYAGVSTAGGVVPAAQLSFDTAGNVALDLVLILSGVLTLPGGTGGPVTVGTYSAGTQLYARVSLYAGLQVRVKAWPSTSVEPDAWALVYTLTGEALLAEPFTQLRLYSRRETGNTNTNPVVSFHNSAVIDDRFNGVVPRWPQTWDLSGVDVTAPVEAAGIMRRLSKSPALASAPLRWLRGLSGGSAPVASWALEDGQLATTAAPVHGTQALRPFVGVHPNGTILTYPQWGRGYLAPWLPSVLSRTASAGPTALWAPVSMPSFAGSWTIDIGYASGTDGPDTAIDVSPSYLGGSASWPQMVLDPGDGEIRVVIAGLTPTEFSTPQLFDGLAHSVRFIYEQDGADANIFVYIDGQFVGSTVYTATVPAMTTIAHVASAGSGAVAIGYLTVWTGVHVDDDHAPAMLGHRGETAITRLTRLCAENNITLQLVRRTAGDDDILVGPQPLDTLLNILAETADVLQGVLAEPRDAYGLQFVDRTFFYNQLDAVAFDYAEGHIAAPFAPVEDDAAVANTVTARRRDGGSVTVTRTDGPLSNQEPPNGVGEAPEDRTYPAYDDEQLVDIAGWRAHLGTWDEARYPQVHIDAGAPGLAADPTLTGRAVMADIGRRVTIDNPPAWLPQELVELAILGCREEHRNYRLDLYWNCVPYGPYRVAQYAIDSIEFLYGAAGTTTAEALDTTETGVDIQVPADHPGWVTTATHPDRYTPAMRIKIGGEEMDATACVSTGALTYTLTVTRSVNGAVQSHDAGAAVAIVNTGRYSY